MTSWLPTAAASGSHANGSLPSSDAGWSHRTVGRRHGKLAAVASTPVSDDDVLSLLDSGYIDDAPLRSPARCAGRCSRPLAARNAKAVLLARDRRAAATCARMAAAYELSRSTGASN